MFSVQTASSLILPPACLAALLKKIRNRKKKGVNEGNREKRLEKSTKNDKRRIWLLFADSLLFNLLEKADLLRRALQERLGTASMVIWVERYRNLILREDNCY